MASGETSFVKILLEELDRNYISLGSTTFKTNRMKKAVEPDDCFYIKDFEKVLGKSKLDLNTDPPPELAIEVDLTSKTQVEAYEGLGVVELWRYDAGKLRIDCLQDSQYVEVEKSSIFPHWLTKRFIEEFLRRSLSVGQGKANKEFRRWVVENIDANAS